jgi:hypothetical protein
MGRRRHGTGSAGRLLVTGVALATALAGSTTLAGAASAAPAKAPAPSAACTGNAAATFDSVRLVSPAGVVRTYDVAPVDTAYGKGVEALLRNNVRSGDTVTVRFRVKEGCQNVQFALASYTAPKDPRTGARPAENSQTLDKRLNALSPAALDAYFRAQRLFNSASTTFSHAGGKTHEMTVRVPVVGGPSVFTPYDPLTGAGCPNAANDPLTSPRRGNELPAGHAYTSTCDGRASLNGNGGGEATGQPCQGCVGNADNKNPRGQAPNGSDANNGYECDGNSGIAKGNPAHTSCAKVAGFQVDFAQGKVLAQLGGPPQGPGYADSHLFDYAIG